MGQGNTGSATNFGELVASTPARERAGTRSSNRFSFQQSWGLGLVLRLHSEPNDYCVIFEVHDDVVVLNNSSDPTKAVFYQVKSLTDGHWTPGDLTKRVKGKAGDKQSILGKLHDHLAKFGDHVEQLNFVSNQRFSVPMENQSNSTELARLCLADASVKTRQSIANKLQKETSALSVDFLSLTFFEFTPISSTEHEIHAEGLVSDFLSRQPDPTIPPRSFFRGLQSEIRLQSNKEAVVSNFAELVRQKGIRRDQFQHMLDTALSQTKRDDLVDCIRTQLSTERDLHFVEIRHVSEAVRTYLALRYDQTNLLIAAATDRADKELRCRYISKEMATSLTGTISLLQSIKCEAFSNIQDTYGPHFLKALIAVAIYEHESLPTSDPQSAEEKS